MPTTTTRLTEISLVAIPSPNQDEAIAFYEALGFEKRTDVPFGNGYRWVEVYPSNGTTGLSIAPPPPDGQTAVDTGVILPTDDIDATHAEMKAAGVDVDDEISRFGDPVPPMFWFRDPNGNRLLIVQRQG